MSLTASLNSTRRRLVPAGLVEKVRVANAALAGVIYRGDRVTCPVCEGTFRRFVAQSKKKHRPVARCPRCRTWARHRLLALFLRNCTEFYSKPLKVLHVAPEP